MLPAITSHKNVRYTFKASMIRKALSSVNFPRFFRLYLYIMWCRLWWTGNRKCSRGKQVGGYCTIRSRHNVPLPWKPRYQETLWSWRCRIS